MQGLVDQDKIKADTKWKTIYSLFKGDERYTNILGNPDSGPLELFWDIIETTANEFLEVQGARR